MTSSVYQLDTKRYKKIPIQFLIGATILVRHTKKSHIVKLIHSSLYSEFKNSENRSFNLGVFFFFFLIIFDNYNFSFVK